MVRPTGHDLITIMFRARHGCAGLCAALPMTCLVLAYYRRLVLAQEETALLPEGEAEP